MMELPKNLADGSGHDLGYMSAKGRAYHRYVLPHPAASNVSNWENLSVCGLTTAFEPIHLLRKVPPLFEELRVEKPVSGFQLQLVLL